MRMGKQDTVFQYSDISGKNELNIQKCHKELMLFGACLKFTTFYECKS